MFPLAINVYNAHYCIIKCRQALVSLVSEIIDNKLPPDTLSIHHALLSRMLCAKLRDNFLRVFDKESFLHD